MAHGRGGAWVKRAVAVAVLVAVTGGGYAALNWSHLKALHAGRQFRVAQTDEQRVLWATQLVALGERGQGELVAAFRSDDEAMCRAAVGALRERFAAIDPTEPEYHGRCQSLTDGFASFSEVGKAGMVELVPELRKCPRPEVADHSHEIVRAGLTLPSPEVRLKALRLAAKADAAPLLDDPDARIRRAAMLAVGPVSGDEAPVVATEDLFRWLHDPDAEVRDYCETALLTRGLDSPHVRLAKLLSHPEPSERLKLLTELQAGGAAVKDPGPWLERLSRDADPAVRLGAARVAFESRLQFAAWLDRLADQDADPTVRRWAGYYRHLSGEVKPTGFEQR